MFDKTYQFLNDIRAKEKQVCSVRLLCVHMEGGTDCMLACREEEETGSILRADGWL